MAEQLEIVCERTGDLTGEILHRPEALAKQAWCRSTNVFVLNSKGEVLCHQRSLQKERLPGVWSTHMGGHVGLGETYESNAVKELEEEAGIKIHAPRLLPWRTTRIEKARLWAKDFVTLIDEPESFFTPQPGEVDQFRWMSLEEIVAKYRVEEGKWCAGIHDFPMEYFCMRSVLNAAHHVGIFAVPKELHVWHPQLGTV